MRILVTGASGFIGRALVPHLRREGHDVVALARGEGAAPLDLATIGGWSGWPSGIEAVVHLGALNPAARDPAARDAAALTRANVDGTRALAARAEEEGVRRFVFLSTANIHSPAGEAPIRESAAPRPQSLYAASKLGAEEALREIEARSAMAVSILRPPPVYGAGGRGAIAGLAKLAHLPAPLPLGTADPSRRRSVLALGNALAAVSLCLTHPKAAGETFLVADEIPLSIGEIVTLMRQGLGWRPAILPFPAATLSGLARLTGHTESFDQMFGGFMLSSEHIRETLGWQPAISSAEGFAAMMRGAPDGAPVREGRP